MCFLSASMSFPESQITSSWVLEKWCKSFSEGQWKKPPLSKKALLKAENGHKKAHVSGLSSQSSWLENSSITPQITQLAHSFSLQPFNSDRWRRTYKSFKQYLIFFLPFGLVFNTIHAYSKMPNCQSYAICHIAVPVPEATDTCQCNDQSDTLTTTSKEQAGALWTWP